MPGANPPRPEQAVQNPVLGHRLHFEAAREINRIEAIQDHIDRFGECSFASLARLLIEQLDKKSGERDVAAVSSTPELEGGATSGAGDPRLEECERQVDPPVGEPDSERAVSACQRAVEHLPNSADAKYLLARAFEDGQNQTEAINWYRSAAELGHADAQNQLGLKYDVGEGVSVDDVEAVRWYQKAADQGLLVARSNLGLMYENGEGVPKNDSEALKWIRMSAEHGLALAQNKLGEDLL